MGRESAKRGALCVAAAACMSVLLIGAAPTPVVVDGRALPLAALADIGGTSYVELRPIGDALGASVSYDARAREATLTTEFRQVIFTIGKPVAVVDGVARAVSAAALFQNGKVLVPLRVVAQTLGASLRYDAGVHAVIVSTAGVNAPSRAPTAPAVPATNTLEGTVTDVRSAMVPPAVAVDVDHLSYTVTVPEGTKVQFRDIHGGSTGAGGLAQVKPGDTLIVTLDASGNLLSVADIFAGYSGTVASASDQNLVLANGRVVTADKTQTAVELDGKPASFADLRSGDLVTVRSDPRTGKVRSVVALTPGGIAASATATPSAQGGGADVKIDAVSDDAQNAFRVGQTLHVRMDGTPGGSATFDLSNVVVDNPMRETTPGHYEGDYVVAVGTNLVDAPIIVRLVKNGLTAQAEGPDPLAIITTPPTVTDAKPDPDSQVNSARPNIYVTFSTVGDRGMDAQSLKLLVNGKDVSRQATRTASFISYFPTSDFGGGPVTVELTGTDTAGNPLSYRWTFTVIR